MIFFIHDKHERIRLAVTTGNGDRGHFSRITNKCVDYLGEDFTFKRLGDALEDQGYVVVTGGHITVAK